MPCERDSPATQWPPFEGKVCSFSVGKEPIPSVANVVRNILVISQVSLGTRLVRPNLSLKWLVGEMSLLSHLYTPRSVWTFNVNCYKTIRLEFSATQGLYLRGKKSLIHPLVQLVGNLSSWGYRDSRSWFMSSSHLYFFSSPWVEATHEAEEEGPVLKRIRPVGHRSYLFTLHLSKPVTGPQPKEQGWDVKFKHGHKRNQKKYLVDSTNNSPTHYPPEEYHPQRGTQQMKSNSYISPKSPIHQGLFY